MKHQSTTHRGVSRPEMDSNQGPMGNEDQGASDNEMQMQPEMREQMTQRYHQQTRWVPCVLIALGAWLFSSPFSFGYAKETALMRSDVVSALALIGLGVAWCASPRHPTVPWAACFLGPWLSFALLVFWAKSPAAFLTDTFVGAWVIALAILIPGTPAIVSHIRRAGLTWSQDV